MVVYNLICKKRHRFEGWFPDFEGYQQQAKKGQISCPVCGSTKVEKVPHACAVHIKRAEKKKPTQEKRPVRQVPPLSDGESKEVLIRLHDYVRKNFEDVGPRFAEEARQIFHGEVEARAIHGTSTAEELTALDEEGVPYAILPKPKLDS